MSLTVNVSTATAIRGLIEDAESVASALRVAADYARLEHHTGLSEDAETRRETIRTSLEIARRVASRLAYHIQQQEERMS